MSKKELVREFKLTLEEEQLVMREYTDEEVQCFLEEDKLDPETLAKVHRLLEKFTSGDFAPGLEKN